MRVVRKLLTGCAWLGQYQSRVFLIAVFFILNSKTFAQTIVENWCANPPAAAEKGSFTVSALKGCAPLTITVKNTTNSPDNIFRYVYDYKGGDPVATKAGVLETTYRYDKPGRYKILQLGSYDATGSVACQEIEVLDATPPTIRSFTCSNQTVMLDIISDGLAAFSNYDEYIVDWGDGGGVEVIPYLGKAINLKHTYTSAVTRKISVKGNHKAINCGGIATQTVTPGGTLTAPIISRLTRTGTNVTLQLQVTASQLVTVQEKNASGIFENTTITKTGSGQVTIANVAKHPACFKVIAQDGCGNVLESNEVCSIDLTAEAQEKQNKLVWSVPGNSASFHHYTVTRNDAAFRTITNISNNTINDTEGLNCNEEYCYQVTAQVGLAESVSERVCITARSLEVPPAFSTVQVSINTDNRVDLRGLPPIPTSVNPSYKMIVFRRDKPSGPFGQTAEEIDRNIHQDGGVQPNQQSYCYQVVYQNACGVSSEPSKMVCTIYLSSKSGSTLDWTADSPFADEGIHQYVVEKIDQSGVVLEEILVTGTSWRPDQTDFGNQRYRVKAVSTSGSISYSNFYTLIQAPRFFMPDAFTPNNDGINDVLNVAGSVDFESVQLTVYNRWGEVVFHTESREGWDGNIGGQPAQAGTYAYRIVTRDQTGLKTENTGSVLLSR